MTKVRFVSFSLCVMLLFAGVVVAQDKVLSSNNPPVQNESTAPAGAAVLLDQPPNQANGLFSDADCDFCSGGVQSIADALVTDATTISTITVWGGCYPGNVCPTHDFTVLVQADAGEPGAVECSYNMPGNCTATGVVLFGVDEWACTFEALACAVPAGTHWLQIFDSSGPADDWFWEVGDLDPVNGIAGSRWALEAPGVTWNTDTANSLATLVLGAGGGDGGGGDGGTGTPATSGIGVVLLVLAMLGASAFFLRRRATN